VRAIINVSFNGQVRVCRSANDLAVSITKDNCAPKYLFQELTEPFNAMHAVHLVFDPGDSSAQTFIFAEVRAQAISLEGWVDSQEASAFAAEGATQNFVRMRQISTIRVEKGSSDIDWIS
jgi:hypothetical protein